MGDTIQNMLDEMKKQAQTTGDFTVCAFLFSPDGSYDKYAKFSFKLNNTSFEDAFKDCGTQLGIFYKYKGKAGDMEDAKKEEVKEEKGEKPE